MTAETNAAINSLSAKSQSSMQSSTHSASLASNTNKGKHFIDTFSFFKQQQKVRLYS